MKVIIQIPCYNEEEALPITLAELPRQLIGVDKVEWLIINDGSSDRTVEIAIEHGVDHIISHVKNLGLAQGFLSGMTACIHFGADIIVNTDADNQYCAADIQKLIDPILQGEAEYVVGTRPVRDIEHWSLLKKKLQNFGSWVVRRASQTTVEDAPSGFRAITRSAAMRLHVFNRYTYTLETIIQAGRLRIPTLCVPIRTNRDLRPSRLISSIPSYLRKSFTTILRSFMTYEPLRFFLTPALVFFSITLLIGLRFLYFYFNGEGTGHVQSLLLGLGLFVLAVSSTIVGFLADMIAVNRKLLEGMDYRLREMEAMLNSPTDAGNHKQIFSRAYLTFTRSVQADNSSDSAD